MAVKTSAADAANNWEQGFAGAATKYAAGIDAVTTSPGQLAAQQVNAYVQGVQNSARIWQAKMASMDINVWKNAAKTVGAQRLATGATKGKAKMAAFMQQFIPDLTQAVNSLPARGTYEQNMARSRAFADALHAKKGSY